MHLDDINEYISIISAKLSYYRQEHSRIIQHLTTMVGITEESVLYVLGEIGTDMFVWCDRNSLSSWARLVPTFIDNRILRGSTRSIFAIKRYPVDPLVKVFVFKK